MLAFRSADLVPIKSRSVIDVNHELAAETLANLNRRSVPLGGRHHYGSGVASDRLPLSQVREYRRELAMFTLARAALSRLLDAVALIVLIVGGIVAGSVLSAAEDFESEKKKRAHAERSVDRRR